MTYTPREIAPVIKEALKDMPVVLITGMRQSGKSTFLKMEAGLKVYRPINTCNNDVNLKRRDQNGCKIPGNIKRSAYTSF